MIRFAFESEHKIVNHIASLVFNKVDMSNEFPQLLAKENMNNIVVYTDENDMVRGILPCLPLEIVNGVKKYQVGMIGAVAVLPEYRGQNAVFMMLSMLKEQYDLLLISGDKRVYKQVGAEYLLEYKLHRITPVDNKIEHLPATITDVAQMFEVKQLNAIRFDSNKTKYINHFIARLVNEHVKFRTFRKSENAVVYIEIEASGNAEIIDYCGELEDIIELAEQVSHDYKISNLRLFVDKNFNSDNLPTTFKNYTCLGSSEIEIPFISVFYQ